MSGGERERGYGVRKGRTISVKARLRIAEVSKYCMFISSQRVLYVHLKSASTVRSSQVSKCCMFISSVADVLVQCRGSSLAVHIPSHEASQAVQIVSALGQTFVHLVLNEFVVYVTNLMNCISFNLNLCQSVCMKW